MTEAVVSLVAERLGDLLIDKAKFLWGGVSREVKQIQTELNRMKLFLKDADARQDENETIHNLVVEIREIAYDAEDVVETFTVKVAARSRSGGAIPNVLRRYACICIAGCKVGLEIQAINAKISGLTRSLQTYGIRAITEGEGSSSSVYERQRQLRRSYSHVIEEDIFGLEEDIEKLAEQLVDESKHCRVVSIWGMGGLGKTTLAKKVYNHIDVRRYFDASAWTCITQQCQTTDVLQEILLELIPEIKEEIRNMRNIELLRKLYQVQQDKRCLVVLDDIWSKDAWDFLRFAFPNQNTRSKILLTTRNREVAFYVDPIGFLHHHRCLSKDESWELLKKKAFPRRDGAEVTLDKSMEELGRQMVGNCGGLPLAIIVLGGLLATKQTSREWEKVDRNINSYLRKGKAIGQHGGVAQVLALSYNDLPYHLKPCFLYLGNCPEDTWIHVDELYELWVAESIISSEERAEEETMIDVAERYFDELVQRCMVQAQENKLNGRYYAFCKLHDLMRDLCLSKVKEENFFKVIDFRREIREELLNSSSSSSSSSPSNKIRKLSIYLGEGDEQNYVPKHETTTWRLRSVLLFKPARYGQGQISTPPKILKSILNFRLIRILDLQGFDFGEKLPKAIGKLIHLRYLNLCYSRFKKLPSSIGNLKYLQTLDLRNINETVSMPDVLWKMERLTHLYLPEPMDTKGGKLRLHGLNNLETLMNFDTSWCDVKDLFKLRNLRKVGVYIWKKHEDMEAIINCLSINQNHLLDTLIYIQDCNLCSDAELTLLGQLLQCHHLYDLNISGKLPHYHHFSPSLVCLYLINSELEDDPMPTLEKLPNLQVLNLRYHALLGKEMVCSAMGFPQLKLLYLVGLDNLEKWTVNKGAMPNLSHLQIEDCKRLKTVPIGLRFVTTLKVLSIRLMPEEFTNWLQVLFIFLTVPGITSQVICWKSALYQDG